MRVDVLQSGIAGKPRSAIICILMLSTVTVIIEGTMARPATQRQLKTNLPRKSNTELIREAEQRLSALGYWIGSPDGVLNSQDRAALVAFQKERGLEKTGRLSQASIEALRAGAAPTPVETGYPHIEVDLTKQILFFVDASGGVSRILPVSTGSGKLFTSRGRTRRAITPTGKFTVDRKIAGWRKSPLGLLYYPNYITDGIAIHGNPSVPASPASHGCIRIPMFAAKDFSGLTPLGTPVIVHN
jgi:lipoprotein-anchoring transpeptidase ErfK/SrfK